MRTRALNISLDDEDEKPSRWKWKNPFKEWPRPGTKRSRLERLLRRVWLFRWDDHRQFFAGSGIEWCQSQDYRDRKVARLFPKRNWLKEDLPKFFRVPKWRLTEAYWWVSHRLPGRYWHHTLNLGLKPGYYDADAKILNATFEIIRWYVEVQLAGHQDPDRDQYKWYGDRSPEAGLAHLDWEITDCSGPPGSTTIGQGEAAQIKKDCYLWWTVDRVNRINPHDLYDILAPDRHSTEDDRGLLWSIFNADKGPNYTRAMWGSSGLEQFYKTEDKEMLIKANSIHEFWWD